MTGKLRPTFSLRNIFRRRAEVVLQAEAAECGLACLAMISSYHGLHYDLSALRFKLSTSLRGVNLNQLMDMAAQLGFSPRALRLEMSAIRRLRTPCILHWSLDHFVVLERAETNRAVILDPAVGRRTLSIEEIGKHFSGIALELTPSEHFEARVERTSLTLGSFFRGVRGLPLSLSKIFAFSIAIQSIVLLMPFYSQLVIDDVVASHDLNFLAVLALGFGVLGVLNVLLGAIRSSVVIQLGAIIQFEWAVRLFHHLIRLPLSFFERRAMADVLSRFKSLASIQNLTSNAIVEAVIDGLMTITTLIVMLAYSVKLTAIPISALAAYMVLRMCLYSPQRQNAHEALICAAKEDGHFLESLRGILAIKSFSREQIRESSWQNRASDAVQARMKALAFGTGEALANQALFALENVIVLWVGAQLVITNDLSIGMLVAFLAYRGQFTSRASALVDKLIEFRMIDVHLDRISDIALAIGEQSASDNESNPIRLRGSIQVVGVSFRYAANEVQVVSNANFIIEPGECIGIFAPSGTGKTTLIKLLMGLLQPESGKILIDGLNIVGMNAARYRRQIAAVMQEDTLLSGSLAENIAFFDPSPDRNRIEQCAKLAAVHEDIARMPMGYYTLVGDMGAALSGGQKQRVLMARAIYAAPRILFLDEATSHIDPEMERAIHSALADLHITRIIVAHRTETLAIADRVLTWDQIVESANAKSTD